MEACESTRASSRRGAACWQNIPAQDFFFGTQEYVLRVDPGTEIAMCVVLCIAYDEFHNEQ